MKEFIPWINFLLLTVLASVAIITAYKAWRHGRPRRALLTFLAIDFTFVAVFIYFFSVNPAATPDTWIFDQPFGQVAYWAVYTSLIVSYLGYLSEHDQLDEEVRQIVQKVKDDSS